MGKKVTVHLGSSMNKVTEKKQWASRKKNNRKESNSGQVGKKETGKKVTVHLGSSMNKVTGKKTSVQVGKRVTGKKVTVGKWEKRNRKKGNSSFG